MTKIYTKTGDDGTTSLYGGRRVPKNDLQVTAYGTVDELNSFLGLLITQIRQDKKVISFLAKIQSDLFTLGAYLSGDNLSLDHLEKRIIALENHIDEIDSKLPPLNNFILPNGGRGTSFAHVARCVSRRAEREVIRFYRDRKMANRTVIIYLNRLSDFLFMLARYLNHLEGKSDIVWKK